MNLIFDKHLVSQFYSEIESDKLLIEVVEQAEGQFKDWPAVG